MQEIFDRDHVKFKLHERVNAHTSHAHAEYELAMMFLSQLFSVNGSGSAPLTLRYDAQTPVAEVITRLESPRQAFASYQLLVEALPEMNFQNPQHVYVAWLALRDLSAGKQPQPSDLVRELPPLADDELEPQYL